MALDFGMSGHGGVIYIFACIVSKLSEYEMCIAKRAWLEAWEARYAVSFSELYLYQAIVWIHCRWEGTEDAIGPFRVVLVKWCPISNHVAFRVCHWLVASVGSSINMPAVEQSLINFQ